MEQHNESLDIVNAAFRMAEAVSRFSEQARQFYYAVMLAGCTCPICNGPLEMADEGRCKCCDCDHVFDPTIEFQRCSACSGKLQLRVRRYACSHCETDATSRFLFDGLVFDAEYFRQKMAECRERKVELRERVRQMLADSRSPAIDTLPINLAEMGDLAVVLDGLAGSIEPVYDLQPTHAFNLPRYQAHINGHIGQIAISLEQIPPLSENTRLDRIWRFVAIIFLVHAGILDVWQDGQTIMVMKREINTERQGVPGNSEEADGVA